MDDVVVNQNMKEVEGLCALCMCVCPCVCVHDVFSCITAALSSSVVEAKLKYGE